MSEVPLYMSMRRLLHKASIQGQIQVGEGLGFRVAISGFVVWGWG